jgi:hypothetical protein
MTALTLLVLLGAAGSAAPAAADAEKHRAGVVFLPDKGVDAAVFAEVQGFFTKANAFYADDVLLIGDGPRKPLKQRLSKCGADVTCLTKIGRNNKLTEIVLARGHVRAEGGVQVVFTAVSVAQAAIAREIALELTSADAVRSELARTYFEIVGITTPGTLTIEHAPATVSVDGRDLPTRDGAISVLPGPHTLRVGSEEQKVMVLPGEARVLTFASLQPPPPAPPSAPVAVAAAGQGSAPAAGDASKAPGPAVTPAAGGSAASGKEPTPSATSASSPPEPPPAVAEEGFTLPPHLVQWIGVGVAGVGVVLVGVGGAYGAQTEVQLESSTSQAEAQRLNQDARSAARTANTLFGVGAGLLALGAAVWAVDFFILGQPARVTAAPADGSVWIGLRGSF